MHNYILIQFTGLGDFTYGIILLGYRRSMPTYIHNNVFRAATESNKWQSDTRSPEQMIQDVLDWWEDQPNSTEYSQTCVLEAILEALENKEKVIKHLLYKNAH